MLTGDKLETAKCIAISTGIKSHKESVFEMRDLLDNSDIIDRFLINLFMLEFSQILSHILFKKMDDSQ